MSVRNILATKGSDVFTLARDHSGLEAIRALAQYNVGALVVTGSDMSIEGIVSERDIVRAINRVGAKALELPVSEFMTAKVRTCTEDATVPELMELMTEGRFRHLPVERDGKLVGVVSIGDVVKRRIEEVEREAEDIRSYIASA